jgi:LPXTG-motif cell wall-anchored protein
MNIRTLGPALMITLGGLIVVVPAGGLANGGTQVTCDTVIQVAVVDPDCCPIDATPGEVDPNECCAPPNPAQVVEPCVIDTVPDATDGPPTTEDLGSEGSGIPKTGSTDYGYLLLGGGLILGGALLLVTGRRSKQAA